MSALTNSTAASPDPTPAPNRQRQVVVGKRACVWPPSRRLLAIRRLHQDDLLEVVHAGHDDRVLVVGDATADALCDVMHRGCRSGSTFRTAPAHPEAAEVVVAPAVRTEEAGQAVVACAHRALPPGGRLALRTTGQGAVELARKIADRLRAYGFEGVQMHGWPEGTLVVCRVPVSGRKAR